MYLLQSGEATCSEVFIKCFLRVPLAVGLILCCPLQNICYKLMPPTVVMLYVAAEGQDIFADKLKLFMRDIWLSSSQERLSTACANIPRWPHYILQSWAKEWSLGCVNLHPTARGSQEAGFTQPRDRSFAQPCRLCHTHNVIDLY